MTGKVYRPTEADSDELMVQITRAKRLVRENPCEANKRYLERLEAVQGEVVNELTARRAARASRSKYAPPNKTTGGR